jgi:hypothetical protein
MHRPGLGSQVSHYAPPMRNEHTVQEEMGVPGNLVGLIIGRGGENLKRIERETGCKVQFSQGKLHGLFYCSQSLKAKAKWSLGNVINVLICYCSECLMGFIRWQL